MSSGNITDSSNNGNGADKVDWQCVASPDLIKQVEDSLEVQIAKFDEQLCHRCDKLMKWAAKQEAQRKAEEEQKKAEEEAKKKAKEDAQKRAEFQAWWQAELERKAKEKAEAKAAAKAMRAHIAQNAAQGTKPKPKQCWAASQHAPNEEVEGWYPPCDQCRKSGDSKPDPVTQVLDWRLGEVITAIDHNTRELARLRGKMDGFTWEMKRMADQSNRKGKGKARPEETEVEVKRP
ncbi:hypothetical protein SCLCIDRAFT_34463 [Scleroderma citrinum Foug A]|uniref:Uncharacterized protein n=1 Tax=Scleroderma citrinum Foug A TaxID=1036808 RepID=A0A0C2ZB12_9AGAM|nr:hypothetical protein SCLCIDRAFT_34463 [Scleroderma citrinum Foug A]